MFSRCVTGKVPQDYPAAKREAARLTWKNKKHGGASVVKPYFCDKCGQWHVGRGAKGRAKPGLTLE